MAFDALLQLPNAFRGTESRSSQLLSEFKLLEKTSQRKDKPVLGSQPVSARLSSGCLNADGRSPSSKSSSSAQFGEIASLATSLLGSGLGGALGSAGGLAGTAGSAAGAAGGVGNAISQIGQLYQLAQGALQLTGTGVGVLNQASEGNWFPAVLEQTAKSSHGLMGGPLSLGALGPKPATSSAIGSEFGTSFPAPEVDDYNENTQLPTAENKKKGPETPDGLVDFGFGDYDLDKEKSTTTEATTTEVVTLFPTNTEPTTEPPTTSEPTRQIRIQLPPKKNTETKTDVDYEELIVTREKTDAAITDNRIDIAENIDELKHNVVANGAKTNKPVPKLDRLVEVLKKSKLSNKEIQEIVSQVEGNGRIELPPKIDFNSAVQNIPEKKQVIREKIAVASRTINQNFENQQKTQKENLDELKVVPDLARSNRNAPPQLPVTQPVAPAPVASHLPGQLPTAPYFQPQQVQHPQVLQSYYAQGPYHQQANVYTPSAAWTHQTALPTPHAANVAPNGQPQNFPPHNFYQPYPGYPNQQQLVHPNFLHNHLQHPLLAHHQLAHQQQSQLPQHQTVQPQNQPQLQQQFPYRTQGYQQLPPQQQNIHQQLPPQNVQHQLSQQNVQHQLPQQQIQQRIPQQYVQQQQVYVPAAHLQSVNGDVHHQKPPAALGTNLPNKAAQFATPTHKVAQRALPNPSRLPAAGAKNLPSNLPKRKTLTGYSNQRAPQQFRSWTESISRTTQRPDSKLYPTPRQRFLASTPSPTTFRHSN
ncbi:unnamed protein product [Caenorhabditis auriculariae]|uniref:Uncharacterized protein n=1 Tax=Caenorhabditis auriculariae TaxID=2777116 RepID=A0A8S1H2D6_9PELO|nr:unnamed protein product [Caenorhabditis auriculariae]